MRWRVHFTSLYKGQKEKNPIFEIKVDTEKNRNIFRKDLEIGELTQLDLLKVLVIKKLN